jgi:hypothetical protein
MKDTLLGMTGAELLRSLRKPPKLVGLSVQARLQEIPPDSKFGYVYVTALDSQRVKIGKSQKPNRRLQNPEFLFCGGVDACVLLFRFADLRLSGRIETHIFAHLDDLRLGAREVFLLPALAQRKPVAIHAFGLFVRGILENLGLEWQGDYWSVPAGQEIKPAKHFGSTVVLSEASKARWADPAYREKMRELNLTPERRAKRSAVATAMWQKPEERKRMSGQLKAHWQDLEYRKKWLAARWSRAQREKFSRFRMGKKPGGPV